MRLDDPKDCLINADKTRHTLSMWNTIVLEVQISEQKNIDNKQI